MAKLKLNPEPTFKAKVSIPVPGAKPAQVEFTFKHRTKKQVLEWRQSLAEMRESGAERTDADDAALIMDFILGWELDDEFNADNVIRLIDSYPGATAAMFDTYCSELGNFRLGN